MKGKPLSELKLLHVANDKARIGVDEATGWIRSFEWLRPEGAVDLFAQTRRPIEGYIGGVRIFDEVSRTWYDDLDEQFEVTWDERGGDAGTLSFEKRFADAPFKTRVTLTLEGERLSWDVELTQEKGEAGNRQVKVVFFLPLIPGWRFWAPAVGTPFDVDGMSSFEFMYNQGPYYGDHEIMLPVVSHYGPSDDVGYTVCDHFDRNVPASKFQYSNGRYDFNWSQYFSVPNWEEYPYLEVVHPYIGMRGERACTTGIQVFAHEGDWRPGLGRVVEQYPEFFYPPVEETWDRAGVYTCNGVGLANEIDEYKLFDLKYLEVHGHFPWYGNYFTDDEEWHTINELEQRRDGTVKPGQEFETLTRAKCEERLRAIRDAGINPYWYMNYSDGYEDEVEARWPESIAKQEDGEFARSGWRYCHLMNPDPGLPFGKHIIENARGVLERYPALTGFFLDCFRHFEFDFAHDDGTTLANNTPVYSISWGLARLHEEVSVLLRERGLDCFANKPRTITTMRWVDGMLLEGQGDAEEAKWFWTCVAKPMYFLWGALKKPQEEYLKRSVILGCWPRTPGGAWQTDERERAFQKKLYDAYMPLYEHFRRRVVCFEPDPLHPSDGLYGQIFTKPDGSYVATVMTDWTSVFDKVVQRAVTPFVAFKLKRADSLGDVYVHFAGEAEARQADFYRTEDGLLVVDMPDFRTAAVIVLKEGTGSNNLGIKRLRDTHDYCGDPTSAFEFGSGAGK